MADFKHFLTLHQQEDPLLIGNVWNAQSAKVLERSNLRALATSSSAVAEALGYADGEVMSFEEYLYVVKRIVDSCSLPLSVDLEGGYGKSAADIVANIRRLHALGVVGINIEDSQIEGGTRKLLSAESFAGKLKHISDQLRQENIDLFINVRCDSYLLGLSDARKEGIRRITLYASQGIHGLFLPCITDVEDIAASVNAVRLPLNVMCMPDLPDFKTLRLAGVKRISMGNALNQVIYATLESKALQVMKDQNFSSLF